MSRKLLDEVREEYKLLPFAARWFEGGRSEMAIRRLEQQGISAPAQQEEFRDITVIAVEEPTHFSGTCH